MMGYVILSSFHSKTATIILFEEADQFTSTTQTFYKSLVPLLLRKPKH